MNFKRLGFICILFLVYLSTATMARAQDLIVEHNPATGNFATIQAAIEYARNQLSSPLPANSFRIKVMADPLPYSGPITPISNVPIFGSSTAGTFIIGSGSAPAMTLNGVSNVTIKNLTFLGSPVGVSIVNSDTVNVSSNIFEVGTGGIAIQVQNSPNATIINNTFYQNGTAISTGSDLLITNNIFSSNTTALAATVPLKKLTYNDYFGNGSNGVVSLDLNSIPNAKAPNPDPLFVHPADGDYHLRDFHLQSGSPAHAYAGQPAGNPNYPNSFDSSTFDMGAYGGPNSDTVLSPVPGVTSVLNPDASITISWSANPSPQVTGYKIYYGVASGIYDGKNAVEGISPILVSGTDTSITLHGLTATAVVRPPAPTQLRVSPVNQGLSLTWNPSSGATGYRIYYSTTHFDASSLPSNPVAVSGGSTSSYTITGLNNGTTYYVAVTAVAQTIYHFAVTAVTSTGESAFSQETTQGVGPTLEGDLSHQVSDFPEAIAPYPNLKSEGCFIATAAYGFYSAPQVQALRDFRDRYLLTNAPGRALVAWYYRYGPMGAHFLNLHPWLKPPVRLLLLPVVLMSVLLVYGSAAAKFSVAILATALCILLFRRRMQLTAGGAR